MYSGCHDTSCYLRLRPHAPKDTRLPVFPCSDHEHEPNVTWKTASPSHGFTESRSYRYRDDRSLLLAPYPRRGHRVQQRRCRWALLEALPCHHQHIRTSGKGSRRLSFTGLLVQAQPALLSVRAQQWNPAHPQAMTPVPPVTNRRHPPAALIFTSEFLPLLQSPQGLMQGHTTH